MAGTQKVPAISIIYRPQTKIIIFFTTFIQNTSLHFAGKVVLY
jgi:hypothetical protein